MKTWIRPKFRILILIFGLNVAWVLAAWLCFERETWHWLMPIALSINFLLLTYDQILRFPFAPEEPLLGQDPWGLLKVVHVAAEDVGVKAPSVFLVPSPSAQIFCYAKRKGHARLYLTEGLLRLLTPEELKAVLVYQLVALRFSFPLLNYWISALLDLIYRVGLSLERLFRLVFGWTPPIAALIVSPWTLTLQHLLLSTRDFHKLDHEVAVRLKHPEPLVQALYKMEAYSRTQPWPNPWTVAHMCMVNPIHVQRPSLFPRWWIQPTLKGRIKNLLGRANP